MKSPFPGMDPYIEACGLWGDFHTHLIAKISERLADAVPDRYVVRSGERSYVVAHEEHREAFIDIYETSPELRLVTAIEVLSPSNKHPGTEGWDLYQRKRQSLLLSDLNLVEIDLLRGGQRMPMLDPWPDSPYTLLVARAKKFQHCRVWPAHFQRPLPTLPVPLAKPDADVPIDLQSMIDAIYQRSRYERSIDYSKLLRPPLDSKDNTRLERQMQAKGSRKSV